MDFFKNFLKHEGIEGIKRHFSLTFLTREPFEPIFKKLFKNGTLIPSIPSPLIGLFLGLLLHFGTMAIALLLWYILIGRTL